ncbi:glycosyltransferase family 39 protein [Sphaerospermopsis aphanizomenoides BCCUSP55]|uniref:ArnT family glycosyltransferase n=1 Tax=Sphaerospermopsis aphanizomenoides TaxID=459663 RepID=UPI001905D8E8|nr:glycosyltransferase family 39 protein [Sphaerospermopsis aphanizomenoides]MBK1989937.1 glycosyltransferase family 39 protein [Sphaerospermopsis aphanizomenoides BCCUSP55]
MLDSIFPFFNSLLARKDWFFCTIITLLGCAIRIYKYDQIPVHNWTADEYAFAWSGMSLIKNHVPTSWSWLKAYGYFPQVYWKEGMYPLVTPWLDHPPLFSLIVGSAAILGGANTFFDCTLTTIRIPSLIFGILSIILFYILSLRLSNTKIAIISSLIFATNPNTVFLSRLAVSENLILFLSLLTLLCFFKYYQSSNLNYLYIAAFLAGLASLAKITGFFLVPMLCLLLIYQKKWREILVVFVIGLLLLSVYFIYGMTYNSELFFKVIQSHAQRFDNFLLFKEIIIKPVFFEDGWLTFSWLILIPALRLSSDNIKSRLIYIPIIIYLFILLFSGSQSHFYAWYLIPLFPFLFLALGKFLDDFIKKTDFLSACLLIIFVGGWSFNYNIQYGLGELFLKAAIIKYLFMVVVCLLIAPFLVHAVIPSGRTKWFASLAAGLIIVVLILGNINIIYNYQ